MTQIVSNRQLATTEIVDDLDQTVNAGLDWLISCQDPEGFWVGMLESNACMEAEWLMAFHFLGFEDDEKVAALAEGILRRQRNDGSWEVYYDAPMGDVNATVESYAALRVAGFDPERPELVKARRWIIEQQALSKTRVFTRYWLALIGEWPWDEVPNVPPEIIYFPRWFPFNIYNFASWARATMLPISLLTSKRAVKPLPKGRRLDELFPDGRDDFDYSLPRNAPKISWENFFRNADRMLHLYQQFGVTPLRDTAVKKVVKWIVDHQDQDGAWGGIQPPWIYSLMALHVNGYDLDHPVIEKGLRALYEHWSYHKDGALYIQASESPVWDTILTLLAFQDCDAVEQYASAVNKAVDWTLGMQVKCPGDWHKKSPGVVPGGWPFERANLNYPDVDDTAVALLVLARMRDHYPDLARLQEALTRGKSWTLAMQSSNGGWGAFDRDNDKTILTKIPFSDFGETLDPPSVDVTAHVVEAMAALGLDEDHPSVRKALDYLKKEQEPDGSWFGRWGVNHIYGTAAVLPALEAVGEEMDQPYIHKAAEWIVSRQNADGGWGETCASYMDDKLRGIGPSTASQTAWALMSLLAVGKKQYVEAITKGVAYLVNTQVDGTWEERHYTGTGFPGYGVGSRLSGRHQRQREKLLQGRELGRGFMINYNLYRHYFPLMALGRARKFLSRC